MQDHWDPPLPALSWKTTGQSQEAVYGHKVRSEFIEDLTKNSVEARILGRLWEVAIRVVLYDAEDVETVYFLSKQTVLCAARTHPCCCYSGGRAVSLSQGPRQAVCIDLDSS